MGMGQQEKVHVQVESIRGFLLSTVSSISQTSLFVHNTSGWNAIDLVLNKTLHVSPQKTKKKKKTEGTVTRALVAASSLNKGRASYPTTETNVVFSIPAFTDTNSGGWGSGGAACTGSDLLGHQSLLPFSPPVNRAGGLGGFDLETLRVPMLIVAVVGAFWWFRRSTPSRRGGGGGFGGGGKNLFLLLFVVDGVAFEVLMLLLFF